MNILYYDLLRKQNIGTWSTHVNEVLTNLKKQGHHILFYDLNIESSNYKKSEVAKVKRTPWGRLGMFWPLLGIFLTFVAEGRIFLSGIFALKNEKKPDIVYCRHALFNFGFWMAKWLDVPAIIEVNGIITDEMRVKEANKSSTALRFVQYIEKVNFAQADKIVVVADKIKDNLIVKYEVPRNKIVVIENGANIDLFKPLNREIVMKKLKLDKNYKYIGFSGSFAPWHGIEDLVKSAPLVLKEVENIKFYLVGDGPMKEKIVGMIEALNLMDYFIFCDMISYEDVPTYVNAFDICIILKKIDILGSPLKLWEYMACGKPVIASYTEEFKILKEYNSGILVNPENPEEIADAIITLLKNKDLRDEMGFNGRNCVVKNHSWESVASKVAEVCRQKVFKEY